MFSATYLLIISVQITKKSLYNFFEFFLTAFNISATTSWFQRYNTAKFSFIFQIFKKIVCILEERYILYILYSQFTILTSYNFYIQNITSQYKVFRRNLLEKPHRIIFTHSRPTIWSETCFISELSGFPTSPSPAALSGVGVKQNRLS